MKCILRISLVNYTILRQFVITFKLQGGT